MFLSFKQDPLHQDMKTNVRPRSILKSSMISKTLENYTLYYINFQQTGDFVKCNGPIFRQTIPIPVQVQKI